MEEHTWLASLPPGAQAIFDGCFLAAREQVERENELLTNVKGTLCLA